jgi:hypothetical protein
MTNYSLSPGHVRLDRFKESGKWYDTFELAMDVPFDLGDRKISLYNDLGPNEAVIFAMVQNDFLATFVAFLWDHHNNWHWVVLEPYNQYSYPVLLRSADLYSIYDDTLRRLRKKPNGD